MDQYVLETEKVKALFNNIEGKHCQIVPFISIDCTVYLKVLWTLGLIKPWNNCNFHTGYRKYIVLLSVHNLVT